MTMRLPKHRYRGLEFLLDQTSGRTLWTTVTGVPCQDAGRPVRPAALTAMTRSCARRKP